MECPFLGCLHDSDTPPNPLLASLDAWQTSSCVLGGWGEGKGGGGFFFLVTNHSKLALSQKKFIENPDLDLSGYPHCTTKA